MKPLSPHATTTEALKAPDDPPPETPLDHLVAPDASDARPLALLLSCGSFSPITNMHLRLLECSRDALRASHHVLGGLLSPTHDGYLKSGMVPARHRLAMARLAVSGSAWLRVDAWEATGDAYRRTHEVVERLQELVAARWPTREVEVFLVCGADFVAGMARPELWRPESVRRLLSVCRVLVLSRGGAGVSEEVWASGNLSGLKERFTEIEGWTSGLSSTIVRSAVKEGRSIMYMTPTKVVQYIELHGLFL